jgi:3-carboxy-cis,cis-muconate cycloisomerase
MSWPQSGTLLGPLFCTEAMAGVFSDAARQQAMLDVEAALARAEAACGIIPSQAAEVIGQTAKTELFDIEALARAAVGGGNLAIPLVKALTAKVAERDAEMARWVHWGATSQDIIDTALVLQIRAALPLIQADLGALGDALAALAETHAATPMAGRTLMQQAVPTTLGAKAAGWLTGIAHSTVRLQAAGEAALTLQFGGAAGTLAALGDKGQGVATALAGQLDLALPPLPWHSQRERIADLGCALALLIGSLGKFARDLALMAQTEIGEFAEASGDGKGGSSAMPHKANPVGCARILAASRRAPGLAATLLAAMDQEHERALGGWHAEWEALPELFGLGSIASAVARELAADGQFHTENMRANLEATGGLIMAEAVTIALGAKLGKSAAQSLIEEAAKRSRAANLPFRDALAADSRITAHLGDAALDELLRPESYLGAAPEMAARAAKHYHAQKRRTSA